MCWLVDGIVRVCVRRREGVCVYACVRVRVCVQRCTSAKVTRRGAQERWTGGVAKTELLHPRTYASS